MAIPKRREVYYNLSQVILPSEDISRFADSESSLCHFCRFALWTGICEDTELFCQHPLEGMGRWACDDVWDGYDCWGFRPWPHLTPDIVAEWVGQRLQGLHVRLPFKDELDANGMLRV